MPLSVWGSCGRALWRVSLEGVPRLPLRTCTPGDRPAAPAPPWWLLLIKPWSPGLHHPPQPFSSLPNPSRQLGAGGCGLPGCWRPRREAPARSCPGSSCLQTPCPGLGSFPRLCRRGASKESRVGGGHGVPGHPAAPKEKPSRGAGGEGAAASRRGSAAI